MNNQYTGIDIARQISQYLEEEHNIKVQEDFIKLHKDQTAYSSAFGFINESKQGKDSLRDYIIDGNQICFEILPFSLKELEHSFIIKV